ncbi:MAG: DUF393 domain-containing protein [Propionibacteriales bacterium]|nr:DUF393 domain-containing protein [Propionibacteriales bacterium]
MRPVLVYDGDCAFCSSTARLLVRWVPTVAAVEPWQRLDLEELGLTETACRESVQWVDAGERPVGGPLALAGFLRSSGGPVWRLIGRVLALPLALRAADPAYRLIARNRHRLPGGTPTCRLPGQR